MKKCMLFEVERERNPRTMWNQVVERDMREHGLRREDAQEREE